MSRVCWIRWYSVVCTYAFILTIWFRRKRHEALFFVAIRWLLVQDEVRSEEYHEGPIGGLAMEVQVLALLRHWLGVLGFTAVVWKWGGGGPSTGEVQSLSFQGENPRSGLNWLYLAIVLLKALFREWGLSSGWKPKIFDRTTIALVHYFFWRRRFWRVWSSGVVSVVVVLLLLLGLEHLSGSFICLVSFSFLLAACIWIAIRELHCCRG
jgi:hypothetical protein